MINYHDGYSLSSISLHLTYGLKHELTTRVIQSLEYLIRFQS